MFAQKSSKFPQKHTPTNHILAKEYYMSEKEPYISAKETNISKEKFTTKPHISLCQPW